MNEIDLETLKKAIKQIRRSWKLSENEWSNSGTRDLSEAIQLLNSLNLGEVSE